MLESTLAFATLYMLQILVSNNVILKIWSKDIIHGHFQGESILKMIELIVFFSYSDCHMSLFCRNAFFKEKIINK